MPIQTPDGQRVRDDQVQAPCSSRLRCASGKKGAFDFCFQLSFQTRKDASIGMRLEHVLKSWHPLQTYCVIGSSVQVGVLCSPAASSYSFASFASSQVPLVSPSICLLASWRTKRETRWRCGEAGGRQGFGKAQSGELALPKRSPLQRLLRNLAKASFGPDAGRYSTTTVSSGQATIPAHRHVGSMSVSMCIQYHET